MLRNKLTHLLIIREKQESWYVGVETLRGILSISALYLNLVEVFVGSEISGNKIQDSEQ